MNNEHQQIWESTINWKKIWTLLRNQTNCADHSETLPFSNYTMDFSRLSMNLHLQIQHVPMVKTLASLVLYRLAWIKILKIDLLWKYQRNNLTANDAESLCNDVGGRLATKDELDKFRYYNFNGVQVVKAVNRLNGSHWLLVSDNSKKVSSNETIESLTGDWHILRENLISTFQKLLAQAGQLLVMFLVHLY